MIFPMEDGIVPVNPRYRKYILVISPLALQFTPPHDEIFLIQIAAIGWPSWQLHPGTP